MRVLLVDDRPDNLYLLRQLLQSRGFQIEEAANGVKALKKLRRGAFELIISDVMMPEMDGFELCHLVKTREQLQHIPFVFYTATYTSERDAALGMSLGASAFIIKPTEPEEFLRRIDEIVSRATQSMPLPPVRPLEERAFLKQYNERLVHKLEDKMLELEAKNAELEDLTQSLEKRVQAAVSTLEERNRELDSFASSVSHDLRQPLRSISSRAQMLMEDVGDKLAPEQREHLVRMIRAAGQMELLIDNMLRYSRLALEEIPVQRVPLEEAVSRALEQLCSRIEETKAQIHIHKPLPAVRAYEPALVQVLVNLFDNALKFTAPGQPPVVEVSAAEQAGRVVLTVRDHGIGIAPQYQERIFKMFERLCTNNPGHGIGLAIVRKGLERMGGSIKVESAPGEGSAFILELQPGG